MADAKEGSRVQVSVRIRPLLKQGKQADKVATSELDDSTISVAEDKRSPKTYVFDNVFGSSTPQSDVYEKIGRPMLEEAYKGFNVCLFAYGQTGSGKTHSLIGDIYDEDKKGITPRFIQDLFDEAQRRVDEDPELTIKVSFTMIEVYMEKVHDLLAPRQKGVESESLEIHEDSNRRVYVKGASVHHVLGYERAMQLLKKGNASRQTAETKMNETSSRSHAIMQISMSQEFESIDKKDLECTISLVDLAGSERQSKTESSGQSFEEAKKINHSLLMLGRALNSFSDRKNQDAFISLRESKLTRLLSESFGGNSKTWMLATVSPTLYNITETISTLDYASNALAITNKVKVNSAYRSMELKELKILVGLLEKRLEAVGRARDKKSVELADLEEEYNVLKLAADSTESQEQTRLHLLDLCNRIKEENALLEKRVAAAEEGVLWSLDNEKCGGFFKGRHQLTLAAIMEQKDSVFSLPLITDTGLVTKTSLRLKLTIHDVRCENVSLFSLSFSLHIVGAANIPQQCSTRSFCSVTVVSDGEQRRFSSGTVEENQCPEYNLVREFQVDNADSKILSEPFLLCEVFAFSY